MEDGTDIRIVLDVKDASDSVGSGDKGLVEAALQEADAVKGYKVGQYLDISLFKIVGESRSAISRTNSKITVTIAIPDSLKNAGGEAATAFAVIRVHDGVAEILNDLDNDPETITIETDRFSTYVIVHSDSQGGDNEGDDNQGDDNEGGDNGGDGNKGDGSQGDGNNDNKGDGSKNDGNSGADNSGVGGNGGTQGSSGADPSQPKDNEPKTGAGSRLGLYVALAMLAGLAYLSLHFAGHRRKK